MGEFKLSEAVYELRRAEDALYDVEMREREPNVSYVHEDDVVERETEYRRRRTELDRLLAASPNPEESKP